MPTCPHCGRSWNRPGITPKQKQVFDFVRTYIAVHGISPSFDEIANACGFKSKSQVHRQIHTLIERGWLDAFKIFGKRVICRSVSIPPDLVNPCSQFIGDAA